MVPEPELEVFDFASKLKLDKTHDLLDRPEKFAKFFVDVSIAQTAIQNRINEMIRKALKDDNDSKKALIELIKSAQKEDWRAFVKSAWGKVALGIWTLIVALFSAWMGHIWK
jgi:hypothetical protein